MMNSLTAVPVAIVSLTASLIAVSIFVPVTRAGTSYAGGPTTQFLKTSGGSIAYDDSGGSGPLVICVPGMGDVRAQYRFLAPALARAGFRVVTMDLRGIGESSVEWPDYSAAAVGADMVAMVEHLKAPHAFIIGNSMASAAAVWAAAERPDRIDGIVLIGPFVREMPTSWAMSALMKVAFVRPWGVPVWSRYYASLYPTSPPADFVSYQADLRKNLSQPGRFAALQEMLGASKAPCEARIPQVKARVLVIMGSKDPDFSDPAAEANLVARRLHGDLLMVDGAGHYPHVEMPEKVEPSIIKFLGGVADGTKNRA